MKELGAMIGLAFGIFIVTFAIGFGFIAAVRLLQAIF